MSKGDLVTIATVPDAATAELLREVLSDGGVIGVDLRAATGVVYMPRSASLEYEVRVDEDDELAARQVLRDFEEESAQAATSQAADLPVAATRPTESPERAGSPRRGLVRLVGVALLLLLVLPLILRLLFHLFAGAAAPDLS